jgi:hypothetical protein
MYYRVVNKYSNEVLIVEELSDFLFEEGYRHVDEVPTACIDVHTLDEVKRQMSIQQYGF